MVHQCTIPWITTGCETCKRARCLEELSGTTSSFGSFDYSNRSDSSFWQQSWICRTRLMFCWFNHNWISCLHRQLSAFSKPRFQPLRDMKEHGWAWESHNSKLIVVSNRAKFVRGVVHICTVTHIRLYGCALVVLVEVGLGVIWHSLRLHMHWINVFLHVHLFFGWAELGVGMCWLSLNLRAHVHTTIIGMYTYTCRVDVLATSNLYFNLWLCHIFRTYTFPGESYGPQASPVLDLVNPLLRGGKWINAIVSFLSSCDSCAPLCCSGQWNEAETDGWRLLAVSASA